jgi:hypothetical protein
VKSEFNNQLQQQQPFFVTLLIDFAKERAPIGQILPNCGLFSGTMARQQSVSQWERSGTGELAATAAAAGSNFDSGSRSYNSTKEWNFDNIDERQEKRVYDAVFESTCEFGDLMQETRIAVDMFSKTIEQQQVNIYILSLYIYCFLFLIFN